MSWSRSETGISYKIGDNVFFCWSDSWLHGSIVGVGQTNNDLTSDQYFIKCESSGQEYSLTDSTSLRPLDFDPTIELEVLIHHMRYNASTDVLQSIVHSFSSDFELETHALYLLGLIITHGKLVYFEWLISQVPDCVTETDDKGRSLLQIILLNKRLDFIRSLESLHTDRSRILTVIIKNSDHFGMNILHYLVTVNDDALTEYCLNGINKTTKALYESLTEFESELDGKGRTALEIATKLKRTHVTRLLNIFQRSVTFFRPLIDMVDHDRNAPFCAQCRAIVRQHNWHNVSFSPFVTSYIKVALYRFVELCWLDDAQYLVQSFDIRDVNSNLDTLYQHDASLTLQILKGPENMWFWPDIFKLPLLVDHAPALDRINRQLRAGLYNVLKYWDFKSDVVTHIVSQRRGTIADNQLANARHDYLGGLLLGVVVPEGVTVDNHHLVCAYIDQFVARCLDEQATERIAMLSWAVHTLNLPLPDLVDFVRLGQLNLLQWVCDSGLVDLSLPVTQYAGLLSQDLSDGSFLTLGEHLCAAAAVLDEFSIFQWLYVSVIPSQDFHMGSDGLSMLHLAATSDSFIVVRWLLDSFSELTSDDALLRSASGLNALHLAIQTNSVRVVMYLQFFIPLEFPDTEGRDCVRYAKTLYEQHPSDETRSVVVLNEKLKSFGLFLSWLENDRTDFTCLWQMVDQTLFIDTLYDNIFYFDGTNPTYSELMFAGIVERMKQVDSLPRLTPKERLWAICTCAILREDEAFFADTQTAMRLRLHNGEFDDRVNDRRSLLRAVDAMIKCATHNNKSAIVLLLHAWRKQLSDALDAESHVSSLCIELYNLLLAPQGVSVEEVQQSLARQQARLVEADRSPLLFENNFAAILAGDLVVEYLEPLAHLGKVSLLEVLIHERQVELVDWFLSHNMMNFSTICAAVNLSVELANCISVTELLMDCLLRYDGALEQVTINTSAEVLNVLSVKKSAFLLDQFVLTVSPVSSQDVAEADGECRFLIFKLLFALLMERETDLRVLLPHTAALRCIEDNKQRMTIAQLAVLNTMRFESHPSQDILSFILRRPDVFGDLDHMLSLAANQSYVDRLIVEVARITLSNEEASAKTSETKSTANGVTGESQGAAVEGEEESEEDLFLRCGQVSAVPK